MAENANEVPNVTDTADAGGDGANSPNTDNNKTRGSPICNPLTRRPRNASNSAIDTPTAQRSFEGVTPAIGGVIAL